MCRRSVQTGELAFANARFRSRLVLWLTAAADQGGGKRDNEKRSQTILLEDECPPSFALLWIFRAKDLSLVQKC